MCVCASFWAGSPKPWPDTQRAEVTGGRMDSLTQRCAVPGSFSYRVSPKRAGSWDPAGQTPPSAPMATLQQACPSRDLPPVFWAVLSGRVGEWGGEGLATGFSLRPKKGNNCQCSQIFHLFFKADPFCLQICSQLHNPVVGSTSLLFISWIGTSISLNFSCQKMF